VLGATQGIRLAQSKHFNITRDAYAKVETVAVDPSPAGDLSLIYNFMKMLDPTSVVREREFDNAAKAAPALEKAGISWDKVSALWKGEMLTPRGRADFLHQAKNVFDSQLGSHLNLEQQYRGLAKRNQIPPRDVVIDYVGQYRNPGEVGIGMPRMVEPSGMSTNLSGRMAPSGNFDERYQQMSDDELLKALQ